MLQRAASNAYSWWWASHIRTKQSKWLEQNLQDLEEKVAYTLKLIEEDGDSFAKRAEMYYKKRPELISFVEEAYRAYRALAERYDHISTELQNANNTIARICPDQVPYMDDDDDDPGPKGQKKPAAQTKNIPKVPDMPKKDLKGMITMANKKLRSSKSPKKAATVKVAKSGLSKAEGLKEIDNLQKQILALQTGKEFVNSSYESWLAKYWEIEEQIKELQQRVCCLQDEFGHGTLIEDDEARSLMAAAALKSCQETLTHMQEKQEKSAEEAKVERKRIEDARDKFESFKDELIGSEGNRKNPSVKDDYVKAVEESKSSDKDMVKITQHGEDLKIVGEKVKEQFDVGSTGFLTVTEMAEKIDEVVSKVVSLETSFSSQTTLVQRLRTETDELQARIRALENDKAKLINDKKHLSSKLIEMEEKLHRVQDLNQSVEDQNHNLQAHLTEAHYNLDQLSQKLQIQNSDEGRESSSENEKKSPVQVKSQNEIEGQDFALNPKGDLKEPPSVKLPEGREEKHSKEDENKSPVHVQFEKGTEGTEGAKSKASAEDEKKSLAKVLFEQGIGGAEGAEVNTLAEDEKKSLAKVQFEKRSTGTEGSTNIDNENLLAKKPNEEFHSSNVVQNEEKDVVEVKSVEELKRQEKLNDDGVPGKARDLQTEVVNDAKERELCDTPGDHGEVVDQYQARDLQTEVVNDAKERELCDTPGNHGEVVDQYQANGKPGELISEIQEKVKEDKVEEQAASAKTHNFLNVQKQEQATELECEPDWKQMFLKGMENRENTILNEYTSVLRNYKEAKKKLDASGMKSMDNNDETLMQLQQLRSANIEKDEEIQSLRKKLSILQAAFGEYDHERDQSETNNIPTENREAEVSMTPREQSQPTSEIEEKFRMDIDELLEENLEFWLRFSTSFHEIQKFETEVKDLQNDASNLVTRLEEKQAKQEGSSSTRYDLKSDVRPLYKHLCELQSELTSCIEKSLLLKEELTSRCSSLNNIQEEITKALKMSAEDDDFRFTSYQAAKFQGEVLNMKQENNKVADELQAGLDHVKNLQAEVEKTQTMLGEKFKLSDSTSQKLEHSDSKNSIPLRSFIFGVKPKKSRAAFIFSMHPTLARKYNDFKAGVK